MKLSEDLLIREIGDGAQHTAGIVANSYYVRLDGYPLEAEFGTAPVLKVPHDGMGGWDQSTPEDLAGDYRDISALSAVKTPHTIFMRDVPYGVARKGQSPQRSIARYGILQRRADGRELRESDLAVDSIRHRLRAMITEAVRFFEQTGKGIDFVGFEAVPRLKKFITNMDQELGMYNIFLERDNSLTQIDTGLLDPKRAVWWAKPLIRMFPMLQYELMSLVVNAYEKSAGEQAPRHLPQAGIMTKIGAELLYQFTRGVLKVREWRKKRAER